jgi:isochorismate synthase EntC
MTRFAWLLGQDQNRGESAVVVKRLEDQIRNLQREITLPSQEAASIAQLTGSSSSP